ncbi:MAG TPA: electron transport complex subunit RsxC [Clostridiales bacterium]|nr:electron transport complex subunit RsxC [Clostridiales bacterium]
MHGKKWVNKGVHPSHHKGTHDCMSQKITLPDRILMPMQQHIGAPCRLLVARGDRVKVGQLLGKAEKYVSAHVHSSVSGTVSGITALMFPAGNRVETVEIIPDGLQEMWEGISRPKHSTPEEFLQAVADSGLVGLGGAGFPAHVKLKAPPGKKTELLVVNSAECEPYITSDYRECMENAEGIIDGIQQILDHLSIPQAIIGIEDNKPEAVHKLRKLIQKDPRITVQILKTRYPQGAEKMLIYSLTGRKVPAGGLPLDVGIVVMNVNSVSFLSSYLSTGIPLITRRVTVDGNIVARPGNAVVPLGTPVGRVFEFCGGFTREPAKIIMGGPMMGTALYSLDMPVMKYTNALLAFDAKAADRGKETSCIRCGRCVEVCPMDLIPAAINQAALREDVDQLLRLGSINCIECGCCSYICPAARNLAHSMRLAKWQLKKASAKEGSVQ